MSHPLATSNLSLRQLRAFLAVAQESSMTRAAAKLHLTPSALSMLVRAMEDDVGVVGNLAALIRLPQLASADYVAAGLELVKETWPHRGA